ncbi:hypothetical protein PIB30_078591 [Stylosanthes scabra]|uniref:Uncharacterized protein n=1 Tax=Stylosanthes scabra TaxID=79078 RepID=A0ABU6QS41_9FABA|nr:hypothetical protein [Stylosanthes scabra]
MVDKKVVAQSVIVQEAHKVGGKVDMELDPMEVFVGGRMWFECIVVEDIEGGNHMDMVVEEVHNHDKHHHIHLVGMHYRIGCIHSKVEENDAMKKVVVHTHNAPPSLDSPSLDSSQVDYCFVPVAGKEVLLECKYSTGLQRGRTPAARAWNNGRWYLKKALRCSNE